VPCQLLIPLPPHVLLHLPLSPLHPPLCSLTRTFPWQVRISLIASHTTARVSSSRAQLQSSCSSHDVSCVLCLVCLSYASCVLHAGPMDHCSLVGCPADDTTSPQTIPCTHIDTDRRQCGEIIHRTCAISSLPFPLFDNVTGGNISLQAVQTHARCTNHMVRLTCSHICTR
jgi:hypothetical protein